MNVHRLGVGDWEKRGYRVYGGKEWYVSRVRSEQQGQERIGAKEHPQR